MVFQSNVFSELFFQRAYLYSSKLDLSVVLDMISIHFPFFSPIWLRTKYMFKYSLYSICMYSVFFIIKSGSIIYLEHSTALVVLCLLSNCKEITKGFFSSYFLIYLLAYSLFSFFVTPPPSHS